jgi:hypothetical protein
LWEEEKWDFVAQMLRKGWEVEEGVSLEQTLRR